MLKILTILYSLIISSRNFLYNKKILASYKASIPIICVGNATVGGNGKSPIVIKIAQDLKAKGYQPVILSRGYGGKVAGPYILKNHDLPSSVGDEPVMLSRATGCPVVISRKRVAGAKLIESEVLGNIIIMDDGYQHRSLERNLNILCFDVSSEEAITLATNETLLPVGRLRERLSAAIQRCHLVILNSRKNEFSTLDQTKLCKLFAKLPIYETRLVTQGLINLASTEKQSISTGKVVLVSSIAKPEGFKETVLSNGFQVAKTFFYPDHYELTDREIKLVRQDFPDLPIICTSKDAVKIQGKSLDANIWELKTELQFKESSPDWITYCVA